MPNLALRVTRRLQRSLRTRGFVGSLAHALDALGAHLRGRAPAHPDAAADEDFDRRFGVDTSGVIAQADLDVDDPSWVHGSAYVATSPIDFAEVLAPFALDPARAAFVDLGCGKGRVLMMAGALPFQRVLGVEYSQTLADIARRNLASYRGARRAQSIEVVTGDASAFAYPEGDLVVFMYHPFDEVVMQRVVDALRLRQRTSPHRLLVLYFKPVHAALWQAANFVETRFESSRYSVYEAAPVT
jgi:SAM-dependent methyltransferase